MRVFVSLLAISISLTACDEPKTSSAVKNQDKTAAATQPQSTPVDYHFEITASAQSDYEIRFVVTTNLPTPVQVMASVDLADQKPDETYIGYGERMRLEGPETTFVLDVRSSDRSLPSGSYTAEVTFYPRWGAKDGNAKAAKAPKLTASQPITLKASGESADAVRDRNAKRNWVMENIDMNMPWDEAAIVRRLGPYEKSKSALSNLHDAYYFPKVDMTLIVNQLKQEITIWRSGRAKK